MERKDLGDIPVIGPPPGYRIRPYQTGDAIAWTDIQRESDKGNEFTDRTFDQQFPGAEEIRRRRIFFAEDGDGRPIGTSAAWYGKDGEAGASGLVHWVAVLPTHQRRGVGRALMAHTLREMGKMHQLALLCTDSNRREAVKLYEDFGFVRCAPFS